MSTLDFVRRLAEEHGFTVMDLDWEDGGGTREIRCFLAKGDKSFVAGGKPSMVSGELLECVRYLAEDDFLLGVKADASGVKYTTLLGEIDCNWGADNYLKARDFYIRSLQGTDYRPEEMLPEDYYAVS